MSSYTLGINFITMAALIDGKALADKVLKDVKRKTARLKKKGIIPTLAVLLIGDNPTSLVYIKQKQKIARKIGARVILRHLLQKTAREKLKVAIDKFNQDPSIHGIIIQQPLPRNINTGKASQLIRKDKDVDGFRHDSLFTPPVAMAVLRILQAVKTPRRWPEDSPEVEEFKNWLKKQRISVLGRGQTAGKPIAKILKKTGAKVTVVHSQTKNPKLIIKSADVVITAVGKRGVVKSSMIKKGAILVNVGLHQENNQLCGDYNETDIAKKASFYTPTPGGVGPVNVACLWENVVLATEKQNV